MDNIVKIDFTDVDVITVKPELDDFGDITIRLEMTNENISLNLLINEAEFQRIHNDLCKQLDYDTYEELEETASNLRYKLMDLKDKYEELKEAYEELKRR